MARRTRYWHILQTAKQEALLAVDLYNRPRAHRHLEAHVVHMHLAWLYLAHAIFTRDRRDFRLWDSRRRPPRLLRTESGDVRVWDLRTCIRAIYSNSADPVRANVEFFIDLRNKIEHRHAQLLEAVVSGKIQSNVLNFERLVTTEFGKEEGLGDQIRLPIFLSTLTEDAAAAVRSAYSLLPIKLRNFVTEYDQQFPEDIRNDPQYELRLYLIPKVGTAAKADAALEFVPLNQLTGDQRKTIEQMQVVIRDRHVQVANLDLLKPSRVAELVEAQIPWRFSLYGSHTRAWQYFEVRPPTGASDPSKTDSRYCVFDEAHGDYLYTHAWVKKLVRELSPPDAYRVIFGADPQPKRSPTETASDNLEPNEESRPIRSD